MGKITIRINIIFTIICALFINSNLAFAEQTMLILEHSETLSFDEQKYPDCQILKGNVRFRHDDAIMYCDSAYFYETQNLIDANGNIHIIQDDSTDIYGDRLIYSGKTKLARLRNNIRLLNDGKILYTDSLNFDRVNDIAYYFNNGKIVDSTNVLRSLNGKYYTEKDYAVFQKNVTLTNPEYILQSDTLRYDTNTRIADILGPSTIVYEDSTFIYTEFGWHNTISESSKLLKNSYIHNYKGNKLIGDTIFYDKPKQTAEAFDNVIMTDSTNSVIIKSNYGFFDETKDSALVREKATFISYSDNPNDSLFLAADTMFYTTKNDITKVKAYYNAQAWSIDMQGICDSLQYSTLDSTMYLYGNPIVWSDSTQVFADEMEILTANNEVYKMKAISNAFAFSKEDTIVYNQMSGKLITAHINDGAIYKIDVSGNALTVYFVEEEQPKDNLSTQQNPEKVYTGINNAESSELVIYLNEDQKVKRTIMLPASNGTLFTPKSMNNTTVTRLKDFKDFSELRPADKQDIYNHKNRKASESETDSKAKRRRKRIY